MIDPFVFLAPVFLLAVVALLRFVGCNWVYGLEPTRLGKPPKITISPGSVDADALTGPIELTVNLVAGSDEFDSTSVVFLGESQLTPKPASTATQLFVDITLDDIAAIGPVNVIAKNSAGNSDPQIFTVNPGMSHDVGFDPQPPIDVNSMVIGVYKNLDFGSNQWIWSFQPAGSVISFTTAATFSFANGKRVLATVAVYPRDVGTVTVSDDTSLNPDGNQPRSRTFTAAEVQLGFFLVVPTLWTKFSKTITIAFSAAPPLPVLEISYFGPL